VLGAFVEWRAGEGAPELPTLEDSVGGETFDADTYLGNYFGDDPMASLSLLQRAAMWRYLLRWSDNAYFPGRPATVLRWDRHGERWTLTTRTLPKEGGPWVQSMIAPLGEWAAEGTQERLWFAGYILDEHSRRPVLTWRVGRESFRFEGRFEDI
jgi:hypothetical protein